MGSKAVHQLPATTSQDPSDVMYLVRYIGGVPQDRSIPRDLIGYQVEDQSTTILSADVLTLFTTSYPVVFGTVGKIIIPRRVILTMTGATTDYVTNTDAIFGSATTIDDTHYTLIGRLPVIGAETTVVLDALSVLGVVTSVVSGEDLHIRIRTGNPTGGDGDITVKVYYEKIDA